MRDLPGGARTLALSGVLAHEFHALNGSDGLSV
jgi:hypothetical protein